jgi:hypothetical protein
MGCQWFHLDIDLGPQVLDALPIRLEVRTNSGSNMHDVYPPSAPRISVNVMTGLWVTVWLLVPFDHGVNLNDCQAGSSDQPPVFASASAQISFQASET